MWRPGAAPIRASCPTVFLAGLSVPRQAAHYDAAIRAPPACSSPRLPACDVPPGSGPRIVGFATADGARHASQRAATGGRRGRDAVCAGRLARPRRGPQLMRAPAGYLAEIGCKSASSGCCAKTRADGSTSGWAEAGGGGADPVRRASRCRRRRSSGTRSSDCWRAPIPPEAGE